VHARFGDRAAREHLLRLDRPRDRRPAGRDRLPALRRARPRRPHAGPDLRRRGRHRRVRHRVRARGRGPGGRGRQVQGVPRQRDARGPSRAATPDAVRPSRRPRRDRPSHSRPTARQRDGRRPARAAGRRGHRARSCAAQGRRPGRAARLLLRRRRPQGDPGLRPRRAASLGGGDQRDGARRLLAALPGRRRDHRPRDRRRDGGWRCAPTSASRRAPASTASPRSRSAFPTRRRPSASSRRS